MQCGGQWGHYEREQSPQPSVAQILWANFLCVYAGVQLGGTKECLRGKRVRGFTIGAWLPCHIGPLHWGVKQDNDLQLQNLASNMSLITLEENLQSQSFDEEPESKGG